MNSRWSTEEKNKLIKLYSNKKTFAEIGKILKRSSNAIKLRIETIIYTNLEKGKNPKDIAKSLNIDIDTLKQHYYSHKSFKQNRNEKVIDINFDDNINTKIKTKNSIEEENIILEEILKNYKMKKEIKKLYKENKLDKNHKLIYEKLFKK